MNEPKTPDVSENKSEKTYTHKDISDILGVSETTVKSYRRKFPGCIPVASQGKPIRFNDDALAVATRIRDLFSTGMSVEEVRLRLCSEFTWVQADDALAKPSSEARDEAKAAPELSQGMSNVAKSMVTLIQQQKSILQRVQVIEGQLGELGIKGVDVNALKENTRASTQTTELFTNRLDRLDSVTESLAGTVLGLAEKLDRFLGDRAKAREEWQKNRDTLIKEAETASTAAHTTTVVSFQAAQAQKTSHQSPVLEDHTPPRVKDDTPEPSRTFFTHALVVRTVDGRYISAGAKGRGRFSLNDLKAMLVYGFTPPMHFTMQWEPHGEGWWLYLEQPGNPETERLTLLLMELSTSRGENVIEVLQLKRNDETVHPAEICAIIDSIVL